MPLFDADRVLRFTVPGPLLSGNAKTRHAAVKQIDADGNEKFVARAYSTKESRVFAEKVKSIAMRAAWKMQWRPVAWACVDLFIFNSRMDRGNVDKPLADALQGVAYSNDARVIDGRLVKLKDGKGERCVIEVRELAPQDYGY
jgi:Holliday junction resolvase RusA-like endonuclease